MEKQSRRIRIKIYLQMYVYIDKYDLTQLISQLFNHILKQLGVNNQAIYYQKMGITISSSQDKFFYFHQPNQKYINQPAPKNKPGKIFTQCEKLDQLQQEQYQNFPYNAIGALYGNNNKGLTLCGSGALLSPNLVLTVAHNLCDRQSYDFKINFFLSPNDVMSQITGNLCEQFRCPPQFKEKSMKKQQCLQFDYALAKISEIHSKSSQNILKPTIQCRICLLQNKDSKLKIYGYPKSQEHKNYKPLNIQGTKLSIYQYGLSRANRIVRIQDNYIYYKITTFPGQNGCPLIFQQKFIGIHLGSAGDKKDRELNVGRLFTQEIIDSLSKWAQEMKAQTFKKQNENCRFHTLEDKQFQKSNDLIEIKGQNQTRQDPSINQLCLKQNQSFLIKQSQLSHIYDTNQEKNIQLNKKVSKEIKAKQSKKISQQKHYFNHIQQLSKSTPDIRKQTVKQNRVIDEQIQSSLLFKRVNQPFYSCYQFQYLFDQFFIYESIPNDLTQRKPKFKFNKSYSQQLLHHRDKQIMPSHAYQDCQTLFDIIILRFQQSKSFYQNGLQYYDQLQDERMFSFTQFELNKNEKQAT